MKPVLGTLNMPDDYPLSKTDFLTGGYKARVFYRILPIEEDNPVSLTVKNEPASAELKQLVHTIAHRVGRYLERQGWLERDAENDYLALDAADDDPLSVLQGHSISYSIALGPQAGRKVFTLQTLPPVDMDEMHSATVGQVAGFNLHAGVAARGDQRPKLERL